MTTILLDGSKWKSKEDFYDALLPAIGAPDWHDRNLDALNDTILGNDINTARTPYEIRIKGYSAMSQAARDMVERFQALMDHIASKGVPVKSSIDEAGQPDD